MVEEKNRFKDIEFGGASTYRIVVQGALKENWSDRLAGMVITISNTASGSERSTLVGSIRDQAELSGVLETLYALHLSIVKVERVRDKT